MQIYKLDYGLAPIPYGMDDTTLITMPLNVQSELIATSPKLSAGPVAG